MTGFLKLVVLFAALVGAWFAIDYIWTGALDPHAPEIAASFGVMAVLGLVIQLLGVARARR
ncbi:MAG: hypothetical protein R3C00_02420 [Hyphomonas sp.]|nr:hypothetical protein [Hyphomonas sp.]MCB9971447.1 hypothetical protein [Hyphomonas sp.]